MYNTFYNIYIRKMRMQIALIILITSFFIGAISSRPPDSTSFLVIYLFEVRFFPMMGPFINLVLNNNTSIGTVISALNSFPLKFHKSKPTYKAIFRHISSPPSKAILYISIKPLKF